MIGRMHQIRLHILLLVPIIAVMVFPASKTVFAGNMDPCIALRTIGVQGNKAYVQAGAGIVADSVP